MKNAKFLPKWAFLIGRCNQLFSFLFLGDPIFGLFFFSPRKYSFFNYSDIVYSAIHATSLFCYKFQVQTF